MHATNPTTGPTRREVTRIAVGATIGNMLGTTSTVAAVLGTLLVPISLDFGWSRTEVAGAFMAASLAGAATFPLAGRLADRVGTRKVLLVGFALLGAAILGLSAAPANRPAFYALFACAGAVGTLPSTMVLSKLLSQWLDGGRGFWMGLTSGIGNAVGATAMPILAAVLMSAYGWRAAFAGVGGLVLAVGVPVAWLLLREPGHAAQRQAHAPVHREVAGKTLHAAIRDPLFWLILSAVPVAGGALTAVLSNTVPIVMSRGLGIGQATGVVAAFAMVCSVWKPLVGFMLDRSDRPIMVAPFYACAAVGVVGLAHAQDFKVLLLTGVLTGIGLGSEFSVMAYILSRYFGLRAMGSITGIAYSVVLCSNAIIPLALNLAFDRLGTYAPALYIVAGLLLYNAMLFLFLRRYPKDLSAASD